jgi:hypothetical protein
VVALDIGDRYFTMALSKPKLPEDVKLLGQRERICILLDEEGKPKAFGKKAMSDYIEKGGTLIPNFQLGNEVRNTN